MLRSLLGLTTKPHNHEDAEKELAEVMDLFSKYPLYLVETDKNEYERLQGEIRLYKAGKSTAKVAKLRILNDCRALKCRVEKTVNDRTVTAGGEVSASIGVGGLGGHQKLNPPPATDSVGTRPSHSNQPPKVETRASLSTTSAGTLAADKTHFKPQSGVPSLNPRSSLPQTPRMPGHANLKQAIPQVTSGMSYEVDSMVMTGTSAKCPTLNIDSSDCTGAKIISHGPQVSPQVPLPALPRRAVGRRAQRQPRNFMANGGYTCNGSMILCGSSVMGATLNVNATNSSGAVFHRGAHPTRA
ncbi:hypothetical protein DEU56DRAFT_901706 [Suillus clintonianus]|uniref:uncharacterized protein n=1 Tax=Suillus clintonianus TaxID=1904413 RepID=UPI001B877095|nr:uncharacterized protein DEU56DRAFT_901706 [Suillus clintonianus]KAG2135807.1 hypothetical protein DEU56DRAFT_901706 [Suillus clintonianus]